MKKIFVLLTVVALLVVGVAGCDSEEDVTGVAARFSGSPTSGTAPLQVQFTDQSTGEVTAWEWDFDNDGTVDSTSQSPSHTYDTVGKYTVSLTVTGADDSDTETKSNYIETEPVEIVIGYSGDLSGPYSVGVVQMYDAVWDYFRMVEEEGLLPEVTFKSVFRDHHSDYGLIPEQYEAVVAGGALLFHGGGSSEPLLVVAQLAEDEIPGLAGTAPTIGAMQLDWVYFVSGPPLADVEVMLQHIYNTWEGTGKAKIGVVGMSGVDWSLTQSTAAEAFIATHSDKLEWVGAEMPAPGTTLFAGEVDRLEESDYIYVAIPGTGLAAFTAEARNRGYEGGLMSPMYMGFWELVEDAVGSPDDLDGIIGTYYTPFWSDTDTEFITELMTYTELYRPGDVDVVKLGTGRLAGWVEGMVIVEAFRIAIDEVGAENLTGAAINDAFAEVSLTVGGFDSPIEITEDYNAFLRDYMTYAFSTAEGEFVAISDWILPPMYQ